MDYMQSLIIRPVTDGILITYHSELLCVLIKEGFTGKTYSHKDPEKCDRQVGTRQQRVHVERNNPSKYSRDSHDYFNHLLGTGSVIQ